MLVLLEGPDGSGKSTLFNKLKEYGFEGFTMDRHLEFPYHAWKAKLQEYKYGIAVCDRSFLSDLVYRLQDEGPCEGLNLREMAVFLDANVKVVFCNTETCFTDSMARGEDNIVTKDKSDELVKLYHYVKVMIKNFIGTPVIEYNWQRDDVDSIIKFILDRRNK